jgi:hypothetical protein
MAQEAALLTPFTKKNDVYFSFLCAGDLLLIPFPRRGKKRKRQEYTIDSEILEIYEAYKEDGTIKKTRVGRSDDAVLSGDSGKERKGKEKHTAAFPFLEGHVAKERSRHKPDSQEVNQEQV